MKQRLLVSVRGPVEALACAEGGAMIADVEYPASALGTPYPLNIAEVCAKVRAKYPKVQISTNIGEIQHSRANACQAALGVAIAGADLIKFGLAELPLEAAIYQGEKIVRTVRHWFPKKKLFPAVFVDDGMDRFFKPLKDSIKLAVKTKADGVLVDTFEKGIGRGLLDYHKTKAIAKWCKAMHDEGKEAWLAGSITKEQLPELWAAGADVICVRGAACGKKGKGRFAEVEAGIVEDLVATIP
ncbi:MAG: (5-formylfuran-3-yl)methyl phosphate synthase [Phycisphaerales bacterium]